MTYTFERFYLAEHDRQLKRAALILHSEVLASDVVQDAFVTVWERWDDLADPGPYLNRYVLNGCRGNFRKQRSLARAMSRHGADSFSRATEEPLWDALGAMPFELRAPLVRRFYGGMTNGEIAEALAWPPGSVGPRITKGLRYLERSLR